MDEKRWLQKISQGDRNAFSKLLQQHEAGLMRYAVYFLHDTDLAQDAIQETFLRVWRYREKYKGIGSERAYLMRLLKNVCCDLINDNPILPVESPSDHINHTDNPDSGFITAVHNAITELPVDQREVFILSHFDELSYVEIAQLMRCSKGTVASRKRLAIESLRRRLYGWSDENEL